MPPVNRCVDIDHVPSQNQHVDDLAVGEAPQHGSGVSTNDVVVVDSRCEPVPNVPTSRASAGQTDGQRVDSDVVVCMDGMTTSCEAVYQLISDRQSPIEVTCDTACHQYPATVSMPPSDQNTAECCDWQFLAAQRVDPHLLLDVLLARKHRDHAAREFLLGLPASILKKYEIFSRQHPIFVCLDIIH